MGCCSNPVRCFLLFVAVVLGLLCVAGGVAFCVLYYQFAVQMGTKALEARLSELQSQLNQSQIEISTLERQISEVPSQFNMQVATFQSDFEQLEPNVDSDRNDQIAQVRADFQMSLLDSGINASITTADQYRSTFIANVANTLADQLTQMNSSLDTLLASFIADIGSFRDQLSSDWSEAINVVNTRIALSGEHKTYVRYGKSSCPDVTGTNLVYNGYVGGTPYFSQGGAANHLCLPTNPEYGVPTIATTSIVFGSEYESAFLQNQNENVPCAVCSVTERPEVIMIPAKVNCPTSWTREYYGYLYTERNQRTRFVCVDMNPDFIAGKTGHTDGSDLWTVEASCVSLPCPPYNEEAELSCVVCSK